MKKRFLIVISIAGLFFMSCKAFNSTNVRFLESNFINPRCHIVTNPKYMKLAKECKDKYFSLKDYEIAYIGDAYTLTDDNEVTNIHALSNENQIDNWGYNATIFDKDHRLYILINTKAITEKNENLISIICHELSHISSKTSYHYDESYQSEIQRLKNDYGIEVKVHSEY